ncbi:hypothetical protein [Pectobacterium parvum]|uniref:hypothetical protein n=1 Tax=Pectobacterium parvum TaxID=2778550 RepID=UPI00050412B7|nr:hypothetical protein [Pectobacterium parvum]KFX10617.1 hypothetical protein KP17_18190 [Pectobacterium parvum]MCU1800686.1 hypothetical protein [Pectobacterium parvum]
MIIDDRFPKQPLKIKVPLYGKENVGSKCIKDFFSFESYVDILKKLSEFVANHYCVNPYNIEFTASATRALYDLLYMYKCKIPGFRRVALPNFSCPQLLSAILSLRLTPVLYELNNWDAPEILFYNNDFEAIIIPSLLGSRARNHALIKSLIERKVKVIIDDAQSFPNFTSGYYAPYSAILISFGKSKKCRGNGGGAIILGEMERFFYVNRTKVLNSGPSGNVLSTSYGNKKIYAKLSDFLNDYDFFTAPCPTVSEACFITALTNLECYISHHAQNHKKFHALSLAVKKTLGNGSFLALSDISDIPSVFFLLVNNRYELSMQLAAMGIQTTWYYFPLSQLNLPFNYEIIGGSDSESVKLANSSLILPYRTDLTDYEYEILLKSVLTL